MALHTIEVKHLGLASPGVGRQVDLDDLVGSSEIADRLDIAHHTTINTWRRRYPEFPDPVARISRVSLWLWPEVEEWARRTGRLPLENR